MQELNITSDVNYYLWYSSLADKADDASARNEAWKPKPDTSFQDIKTDFFLSR